MFCENTIFSTKFWVLLAEMEMDICFFSLYINLIYGHKDRT